MAAQNVASRRRWPTSAAASLVMVAMATCGVINPRLIWFTLAGLVVGLGVAWLIAAVRRRQWRRLTVRLVVIAVAAVVFLSVFLASQINAPVRKIWSVPITSTSQYRSDEHAFEITDTVTLTKEASTGICAADQPRSGENEPSNGGAAVVDCADGAARNSYVRSKVENAGWTYRDDLDGQPRFTRIRNVAVEVPRWWPLSVTRSVDAPKVELDTSWLVADKDSAITIVGPKHFVRQTVPPASSTGPTLAGDGSEQTKVPISYGDAEGWDSTVRLELLSSAARNVVMAPLVDFSWWAPVKWIVLFVAGAFAAVFTDQLKALILRMFKNLTGRPGPRHQPDSKNAGAGQATRDGSTQSGS